MKIYEFGEPILRQKSKSLDKVDVLKPPTQKLIKDMLEFLASKKLGIGLAAPQVGQAIQLAVILIKPTKHRAKVQDFNLTIINPKIIKTYGNRTQMWEGCISGGSTKSSLFAKVSRYSKLDLSYLDETGKPTQATFSGLPAQVIQHEVDHLRGTLFVDRVKDSKTFMTYNQYIKMTRLKT